MANNETLLEEIRDNFDYCLDAWKDIRDEGKKDVLCIADGPWSVEERKARVDADRPCLALDELSQYLNQAINSVRQNKRAVKVIPDGNGANDQTAYYNAGLIRQIEYQSNGQAAYIGAFESMLNRSYGFWKLTAEYAGPKTFNQKIVIGPIANPDTCLLDPDAKQPDWCDMGYGYLLDSFKEKAFLKRWPDAECRSFDGFAIETAPAWIGVDKIQVAEYWRVEKETRTLVALDIGDPSGPVEIYLDEVDGAKLQDSSMIVKIDGQVHRVPLVNHRKTEDPTVVQYLTNGIEILEKNPSKWCEVPIIPVFGKELYVNAGAGAKRRLISMVRMARDAYMLYCYYRTCEAEVAGMSPKILYMGYEGQFNTNTPWAKINKIGLPYAEVKAQTTTTGSAILPLPTRQPYDPPIQSLEMGAASARQAIQSAMGVSGMLSGQRSQPQEAKSGIALKELDSQTQQGNFHFVDNYDRAIERSGRMIQSAIKWCYDTPREEAIRKPDDTHASVKMNQPIPPAVAGAKADPNAQTSEWNTGDGDHQTTISVGPSQDSQRDAADDFVDTLMGMQNLPPKIMSLAVRLKNLGPIGDEIAKAFDPQDAGPTPQQVAQLQQQLQKAHAFAQTLFEQIQTKQPELANKLQIAAMQEETKRVLGLATINAEQAQMKLDKELGIVDSRVDRAHEANMENLKHKNKKELAAGQQAHDAASQASDQGHEAAQATQAQGAAADSQESAQDASAEQATQAQEATAEMPKAA